MRRSRSSFPVVPVLAIVLLGGAGWMFRPWQWIQSPSLDHEGHKTPVPSLVVGDEPSRADLKTGFKVEAPSLPPESGDDANAQPSIAESDVSSASLAESAPTESVPSSTIATTTLPAATQESNAGDKTPTAADIKPAAPPTEFETRVNAAMNEYKAGKRTEARSTLNAMLLNAETSEQRADLRRHLERIAEEMIWSRERFEGDPLVDVHVVKPGDKLGLIAKPYDIPYELILQINGLADPTKIRANQKLKILRGPFHVRVYKTDFRLDLYVQDTFVRSFRVGLGGENPTPAGEWIVRSRMRNPTYFPSASAKDKRVIPPSDPANPLGGFWVGLEGTTGDAVGQVGFGIHGTNEPESIGRAASLGCVRMLNDEIEVVYRVLLEGKSKVTTLP